MKIIIPGGSGQVGTLLARHFHKNEHDVVVLSRTLYEAPWQVVLWNGETLGSWTAELNGADIVINLAGYSVNCRYTAANRHRIKQSRLNSTEVIGRAIQQTPNPPHLWLQASTATIYAHRYDAYNDEITGLLGGSEANAPDTWRFSIDVARTWERAIDQFDLPHTRKVKMRSAMVMSPDKEGVFDVLLGLVRAGLGGRHGNGRQYISWIHDQDFIRAIHWIIDHPQLSGAINLAAPQPLPNSQFMHALRQASHVRLAIPIPNWLLEIGAFLRRTETELILKSRRVVPTRLDQSGFSFHYPKWNTASADLYRRWLETRSGDPTRYSPPQPQPSSPAL